MSNNYIEQYNKIIKTITILNNTTLNNNQFIMSIFQQYYNHMPRFNNTNIIVFK
eukprot:UN10602